MVGHGFNAWWVTLVGRYFSLTDDDDQDDDTLIKLGVAQTDGKLVARVVADGRTEGLEEEVKDRGWCDVVGEMRESRDAGVGWKGQERECKDVDVG